MKMQPGCLLTLRERKGEQKSREVRIGLVMYGGVSLAIYIFGVAHEFFRAVRGRGVYRLIKALTDSDVVVDVVSGTSAGGINGILLSYALCNNKDFGQASALWRAHGGIRNLLRSPNQHFTESSSLLDSEGYYEPKLEEAFARLDDYQPEEYDDSSEFNELDLFVTGTDVQGRVFTQFDDAGHPIDVKDHRSVFLLKHRKGRKEPFNANFDRGGDPTITYKALAKIARITSCFPAAFSPVYVKRQDPGDDSVDGKLQMWGKLAKEAYFLDGGVLDNKPFTYTARAIFSRAADRQVDRKLFFVEPDPENFGNAQQALPPNLLQAVMSSLIGIPSYESIADDLQLLSEHNSKLYQYKRLIADLEKNSRPAEAVTAKATTVADAAAGSTDGKGERKETATCEIPVGTMRLYTQSRKVFISERVVESIFKAGDRRDRINPQDRKRATDLVRYFDDLSVDIALIDQFDIYYRLRRLFRIVYLIHDLLYPQEGAPHQEITVEKAERYRDLWRVFNRQIKLYEVLRASMEGLLDDTPIRWQEMSNEAVWTEVQAMLLSLLDDNAEHAELIPDGFVADGRGAWLPQETLDLLYKGLRQHAQKIAAKEITPAGHHSLLKTKIDHLEREIIDHFLPESADEVRRAYDNFTALDAHLFPLEMVGGLHEKDIIELTRISPRDATKGFSNSGYSDKVAGDAVHHFAGFFKRSWRSNDILWGRLDGLCQLVESLLAQEMVERIVENAKWRHVVRARFFEPDPQDKSVNRWKEALDPTALFPKSGQKTQKKCRVWLEELLSDNPSLRKDALERFPYMIGLIIEAAQLEVINKELPNVITDALEEQAEWNRYQVARAKKKSRDLNGGRRQAETAGRDQSGGEVEDASPFVFKASGRRLDPFVAVIAAAEKAKAEIMAIDRPGTDISGGAPTRPADTRLGRFFKQSYRVGSEKLTRDMPTLVLLEILAVAMLVFRNCILGMFGSRADRIRRHPLYMFGINLPLKTFYSLVTVSRRAPGWGLGVFLCLGVLCVFTILIGVVWWKSLIYPAELLSMKALLFFLIIPGVILALQILFLSWSTRLFGMMGEGRRQEGGSA